jgi:hypothetical protein
VAKPVTVNVRPFGKVVALYYSINSGPPCPVPGFTPDPNNMSAQLVSFTLSPADCPDAGASYSLAVSAWDQAADCDLAVAYFQYDPNLAPPSQRYANAVAAIAVPDKVKKPTFHAQLDSNKLREYTAGDPVPVYRLNTAQKHHDSTRFYCYWFIRDDTTHKVTGVEALRSGATKQLASQPESITFSLTDTPGIYTLVIMAGAPVQNKDGSPGITLGIQSVSFKVNQLRKLQGQVERVRSRAPRRTSR